MPSVLDVQLPITQVSGRATREDVCDCKSKGRRVSGHEGNLQVKRCYSDFIKHGAGYSQVGW